MVFASNSSRHGSALLARRLTTMGIAASDGDVVAAFDLVGDEILRRLGPVRVMPLGTRDLAELLESPGHKVVPIDEWAEAQAVVVGNDPAFDFGRLRAASRAVAAGAAFFAVNMDARFPVAEDAVRSRLRRPGRGSGRGGGSPADRPSASRIRPCSRSRSRGWAAAPREAAMVGDNLPSDIVGGRAAGMFTIWLDDRS